MECAWFKARYLLVYVCLLTASPSFAILGTIDDVPAATLLLPYFEVSLAPGVADTYFSINNASSTAVLTHVTVWSDQSVPVLGFDVYLTGYDVQSIHLRDVLINGNVPITASVGQDPKDSISPRGPISQDINFPSCATFPYPSGYLSASYRLHLQTWLQGLPSPIPGLTSQCAGSDRDPAPGRQADGILRGYVTIDTVSSCNLLFPSDASYPSILTSQNVLWGSYHFFRNQENLAQGETLVPIEACIGCIPPGRHTFYGRYNGGTGIDRREALPTTFMARYTAGIFNAGTEFLVWRESGSAAAAYPCTLPGPAAWHPLGATQIVLFNEQEQPVTVESCPQADRNCRRRGLLPNEANRVHVANGLFSPFSSGAAYLNLQHRGILSVYNDLSAQAWVTVLMTATGRYSVGFDGIQIDNAARPVTGGL